MSAHGDPDPRLWGWLDAGTPDLFEEAPALAAWLATQIGLERLSLLPPVAFDAAAAPASRLTGEAVARIAACAGADGISLDPTDRARVSLGQSFTDQLQRRSGTVRVLCDAVVRPSSGEAVLALLALAHDCDFTVTPVGGATNVVGAIATLRPAVPWVVLDLRCLAAVKAVNVIDLTVTVEAGIRLVDLEAQLNAQGFTLGHFPQSFMGASLGGSIAAHGAGQSSDGYGRISEMLISATLATPRGWWRTETSRHAGAGPFLGGLVAGSEGMFGIIVEAVLRVRRVPETTDDRAWAMPSFEAGVDAARQLAQAGHGFSMLRLSDVTETSFFSEVRLRRKGLTRPPLAEHLAAAWLRAPHDPALLIASFEGTPRNARRAFADAKTILGSRGGVSLGARPGRAWRRDRFTSPHWRESLLAAGIGIDTFETSAPWSRLGALHASVGAALARAAVAAGPPGARCQVLAHLSHSYPDGASLYFTVVFPMAPDAMAQADQLKRAALDAIVAGGGAVSHHHGLGADHARWAEAEKSALGIEVLAAIASAFDPAGVLSTGSLTCLRSGFLGRDAMPDY